MIRLPWPPGGNRRLIPGRGRWILDPRYRAWKRAAAAYLVGARRVQGPVSLIVHASPPDRRRRDPDGILKALLDALVDARVIEDDSMAVIRRLEVIACDPVAGGSVAIAITQAAPSTETGPPRLGRVKS